MRTTAELEERLARPTPGLVDDLGKLDGDIMILGVGGKMGPTLARLARKAAPDKRVIGVARFSEPGDVVSLRVYGTAEPFIGARVVNLRVPE